MPTLCARCVALVSMAMFISPFSSLIWREKRACKLQSHPVHTYLGASSYSPGSNSTYLGVI